jgi:hypothetical protein
VTCGMALHVPPVAAAQAWPSRVYDAVGGSSGSSKTYQVGGRLAPASSPMEHYLPGIPLLPTLGPASVPEVVCATSRVLSSAFVPL